MRAITQHRYGPPDVLTLDEIPDPTPGPRDIVLDVHAAAVTEGDRRLRAGDYPGITWVPGRLVLGLTGPRARVPGSMFAGRVVAVGSAVTRVAVGDDLFGAGLAGAYAERLLLRDDAAFGPLPAGWSHAEAVTLPFGAGTARHFLQAAALREGERVLVIGAAGGTGRWLVALASAQGAWVSGACRPRHHPLVTALGASEVRDREDLGGGWDLVIDTPGVLSCRDAARLLAPRGRFATLTVSVDALLGAAVGPRAGWPKTITGGAFDDAASIHALRDLAERGALRPNLGPRFPLARAADAHALLERERPPADIVIEPQA